MKFLAFFAFVILLTGGSCSPRMVLTNGYSRTIIKEGDSVILFTSASQDVYPKCSDPGNDIDSLDQLPFKYIHSIYPDRLFVKEIEAYHYDTITQHERHLKRKEDKQTFKKQWKDWSELNYSEADSVYLYIYRRPIYSTPLSVEPNNLNTIARLSYYTECDGTFRMLLKDIRYTFAPNSMPQRLYRWYSKVDKLKIKGSF